jgi:hypothetical protein
MICPHCGWEAREVKLRVQNGRAYTCDNGVCQMCNIVFAVHVLGTLKELEGVVPEDNGFGEREWQ